MHGDIARCRSEGHGVDYVHEKEAWFPPVSSLVAPECTDLHGQFVYHRRLVSCEHFVADEVRGLYLRLWLAVGSAWPAPRGTVAMASARYSISHEPVAGWRALPVSLW